MMDLLRQWLFSVVAVTLFAGILRGLTGEGGVGKVGSFLGGLLLVAAVLKPLPGLDTGALAERMASCTREVEARQQELETGNLTQWAGLIESRTAAYISEQANRMGTPVTAAVRTELSPEGVPVPCEAELTGERTQALAAWLETELGIPEERQVWKHED